MVDIENKLVKIPCEIRKYIDLDIIPFVFPRIVCKLGTDGHVTKRAYGLPKWSQITRENCVPTIIKSDYIHARGIGLITGSKSHLTVIDFDNAETYKQLVKLYPKLIDHWTVKTKKGFHMYCQYDSQFYGGKSGTNVFTEEFDGIDIRANGGIVFAPPTKYLLPDRTLVKYEHISGDKILEIPKIFYDLLKPISTKPKPNSESTKIPSKPSLVLKIKPQQTSPEELIIHKKANQLFQVFHPDSILENIIHETPLITIYEFTKSIHACQICETPDLTDRQYIVYNHETNQYAYKCHDGHNKNKMVYLFDKPYQWKQPNQIINQQELPNYDFHDKKCLMVESGMGTGKTKKLLQFLSTISVVDQPQPSVVILSCRRSLSREFLNKFKTFGFESYLDLKGELDQNRIIVQIDSLHRLAHDKRTWDYLIVDEIDSNLQQFSSNIMKNKHICTEVFEYLINTCQHAILLDAQINTRRVDCLTKQLFGDDHIWYLQNLFIRKTNKQIFLHKNEVSLIDQYINTIKKGKKIAIVSTSKQFIDKIEKITSKYLSDNQYRFYTSKTERNILMTETSNVNVYWITFQVIGFSPSVTMGVSFEQLHFDQMFVYGKSGGPTHLDLLQMMGRIRQLKEGEIHMYLSNETDYLPTKFDQIQQFTKTKNKYITQQLGNDLIHYKINPQGQFYYPNPQEWQYQLYINNLQIQFKSINNFKRKVIEHLSLIKIPITYMASLIEEAKEKTTQIIHQARNEIKDDQHQRILFAPIIDEAQYATLKLKEEKTSNEEVMLLKHHCHQVFHTEQVDMDDYDYHATNMFQNREKLNCLDTKQQLDKITSCSLDYLEQLGKNVSDWADYKSNHPQLNLSRILLCDILGLPNLKKQSIDSFTIKSGIIDHLWSDQHRDLIRENIYGWSVVRGNKNLITPQNFDNWNNTNFIRFTNSIISNYLGLEIKKTKRVRRNMTEDSFYISDRFEKYDLQTIEIDPPTIRLPTQQCLL